MSVMTLNWTISENRFIVLNEITKWGEKEEEIELESSDESSDEETDEFRFHSYPFFMSRRSQLKQFSWSEEHDMWTFLLKEIHDPFTGIIEKNRVKAKGLRIWEKYRDESGVDRSATSLMKRFRRPGFSLPVNFSVDDQIKLHYALGIPLHDSLLNQVLEHAVVDLDESSCIVRYKDLRQGGLNLPQLVSYQIRNQDVPIEEPPEKKACLMVDEVPHAVKMETGYSEEVLESLVANEEVDATTYLESLVTKFQSTK
uniref:SPK domain-containing protein n=1 Tax=Caenorhabditis tropicalis TaxID=1561998 RepID=A0A1I7T2P5_9PELO